MAVFGWCMLLLMALCAAGATLVLFVLGGAFGGRQPGFFDVAIPVGAFGGIGWFLWHTAPFTVILQ